MYVQYVRTYVCRPEWSPKQAASKEPRVTKQEGHIPAKHHAAPSLLFIYILTHSFENYIMQRVSLLSVPCSVTPMLRIGSCAMQSSGILDAAVT